MRKSLWALLLSLLVVLPASAQETRGNISGTVKDAQGVVPGATVKITNTDTNSSQSLVTNGSGYFEAPLLQPGTYTVSVEMPGFKNSSRSGIVLAIGQQITVPVMLEVGQVSEKVTVTAEAPLLDTTAVSSGQNFDSRMVEGLPMFSNMPIMLTRYSSGVNPSTSQSLVSQGFVDGTTTAAGAAVGGVGSNNYSLDGATNTGTGRRIAQSPNSDMVQEMRVESSNFDSSIGHGTGLQISMMTRAGTNAYRGTGNYTYWTNKLNALNPNQVLSFNDKAKDLYESGRSHNFATTFGGPVVLPGLNGRNKLFFFVNYSYVNDYIPGKNQGSSTVPYGAQLDGNFSDLLSLPTPAQYQIYDPLTVRQDPANASRFIRTPFANNIIPQSRIVNPLFALYRDMIPTPNVNFVTDGQVPTNNYYRGGEPDAPTSQLLAGRVDYNKSGNDRFFVRAQGNKFIEKVSDWTYEVPAYEGLHALDRSRPQWSVIGNWTHVAGATVIDSQFATNHFFQGDLLLRLHEYKPTDMGLPTYLDQYCQSQGDCMLPQVGFGTYQGISAGRSSYDIAQNIQGTVNVTQVRGAHTLRSGIDVRTASRQRTPGGSPSGNLSFNNEFTRQASDTAQLTPSNLGTVMAQFMMAIPNTTTATNQTTFNYGNNFMAAFGQDTWRLNRNLTVNLGVRFEWENGISEDANKNIVGYDPTLKLAISDAAEAAYLAIPASQRQLLPATISVRGGSVYADSSLAGNGGRSWAPEAMWMPRFSASYKLGDKTVLKAGYGIYYDTLNATDYGGVTAGYSSTTTNTNSTDFGRTFTLGDPYKGQLGISDPFPVRADGTRFTDPFGSQLGIDTVAGGNFTDQNRNRVHGRQQKWRLGVQREVMKNLSVEVAYDGAYSDKLDVSLRQDFLPEQFWSVGSTNVRDTAQNTLLSASVTNPFAIGNFNAIKTSNPLLFQQMSSNAFFTSGTIVKNRLLRAFPQNSNVGGGTNNTGLVYANLPLGESKVKQLQINVNRRFSGGFTANAALAFANVQANQTVNEFDRAPTIWLDTNDGRPYRLTAGAVYELPFGSGKPMLKNGGVVAAIASGWQVAGTYEIQPGSLLRFNTNLFFYGNVGDVKKSNPEIGLDAKTGVIDATKYWFNVANFEIDSNKTPTAFTTRNSAFPFTIDGLRGPGLSYTNINFQRSIGLGGRRTVQLRMDIQNLFNYAAFGDPSTNPTSTSFGRVITGTTAAGAMRFMSFNVKYNF